MGAAPALLRRRPLGRAAAATLLAALQPGGRVLAVTETVQGTYLVDVATLDTLDRVEFDDEIKGDLTTAHPSLLPSGELLNFISTVRDGGAVPMAATTSAMPPPSCTVPMAATPSAMPQLRSQAGRCRLLMAPASPP